MWQRRGSPGDGGDGPISRGRPPKARSILLVVGALALLVAACAGSAQAPVSRPAGEESSGGGRAPAQGVPGQGAEGEGGGEAEPGGEDQLQDGALIVRTGRLQLEVADMASAVAAGGQLVSGLGGYVSASEESNNGHQQLATITYRIPADRWEEALAGLRGLGTKVVSENTQAVEVTAEVVDLDARIANLRAAETALQEIMNRAGTIEDVLEVQRELTDVRSEIEQLTARRDHLRQQAAYGTLAVTYGVPVVAVTEAQEGWDLGTEVDRAFAQLVRIGQSLASIGVWLAIVALPVLVPLLVVLYVAARLFRRLLPPPAPATPPAGPMGPSM